MTNPETFVIDNTLKWLKQYWIAVLRISYFVLSFTVIVFLLYDRQPLLQKPEPAPIIVKDDTNIKRIESLEQELKSQSTAIKQLQQKNDELAVTNKQLEKRQQTQIEFSKQLCEYIFVITVDKKIIPRQCLSNYDWNKE